MLFTLIGTCDMAVNKVDKISRPYSAYSLGAGADDKQIVIREPNPEGSERKDFAISQEERALQG